MKTRSKAYGGPFEVNQPSRTPTDRRCCGGILAHRPGKTRGQAGRTPWPPLGHGQGGSLLGRKSRASALEGRSAASVPTSSARALSRPGPRPSRRRCSRRASPRGLKDGELGRDLPRSAVSMALTIGSLPFWAAGSLSLTLALHHSV